MTTRVYRAGESIDDLCRACKADREHTVIVADSAGRALRVQCDFCGSQHAYRGGTTPPLVPARRAPTSGDSPQAGQAGEQGRVEKSAIGAMDGWDLVTERECTGESLMVDVAGEGRVALEAVLRRVIREETGLTAVAPAEKWRGGSLVLRPTSTALQEKSWPIETFFHKIVMIRNRLRTLEQQVNALAIDEAAKIKLQAYITGCYGSLTSFNVLFADPDDQFKGASGD